MVAFSLLLVLPVLAAAAPSPQITSPEPGTGFSIRSVSYNGNGCPDGTASYFISGDGKEWKASYDQFAVALAPNATTQSRTSCDAIFDVNVPKGWKFTLGTVGSRYKADVYDDVRAWIETSFTLTGNSTSPAKYLAFRGPVTGDGIGSFNYLSSSLYSPCGGQVTLTLTNFFKLWYPDGYAAKHNVTLPSSATLTTQEGTLSWRKC